jgi:hypothetical protein
MLASAHALAVITACNQQLATVYLRLRMEITAKLTGLQQAKVCLGCRPYLVDFEQFCLVLFGK